MTYTDFHRELRDLGDPKADAVVQELLDEGQVNAVNQLFRQISTADTPVPRQAPAVLREFMDSTRAFPDWMDGGLIQQARAFFRHHHLEASAMRATVGLVGTYLSPVGAYTLHSTHQLADNPHRRLSQSTRLFMGMGDSDAFTEHSKLVPTCQKVRLVHAAIRELHRRSGRWNYGEMGTPVSQLYTAGAALVFSVQVLEGMSNLGRTADSGEAGGRRLLPRLDGHRALPGRARRVHPAGRRQAGGHRPVARGPQDRVGAQRIRGDPDPRVRRAVPARGGQGPPQVEGRGEAP
nr:MULTISPECIES: hypothetical protein [unclassified Nocardiopsis]